jgi:hypothetical protein
LGLLFEANSKEDLLNKIQLFKEAKENFRTEDFKSEIQKYDKNTVCEKMEEIILAI